jgi:CRISPR/Cas system CMR-associated protein Cmr1 (group 7 of RAMP superfamily)
MRIMSVRNCSVALPCVDGAALLLVAKRGGLGSRQRRGQGRIEIESENRSLMWVCFNCFNCGML